MAILSAEALDAIERVLDCFESLGIPYYLAGSFASSVHGVPRATRDLDVVAELTPAHVRPLRTRLGSAFYLDEEAIGDAIRRGGSFNIVDLSSGFKIDVFIRGRAPLDLIEFRRWSHEPLAKEPSRTVPVQSAEDSILRKLAWFELGGSDLQWNDAMGIVKIQSEKLDLDYLHRWSGSLGVTSLLEKLLQQAKTDERPS